MKIAIIGPYPPPYGGISVHIQRMATLLKSANIKYVIYAHSKITKTEKDIVNVGSFKKWLIKYFFLCKEDIIHYHSPDWRPKVIFALLCLRRKKIIFSLHGDLLTRSFYKGGWLTKHLIIFALRRASIIICVNLKIRDFVAQLGVKPYSIKVIPAFIPPPEKIEDRKKVPQYIWDFMADHDNLITATGSLIPYKGLDLYGVHLMIQLLKEIKKRYSNIGILFSVAGHCDSGYLKKIKKKISSYCLNDDFLIVKENDLQFYPILKKSDIFIRPSLADGDAVSVREALYFNIPTIASDICQRPQGTIVFKTNESKDLLEKVINTLENIDAIKEQNTKLKVIDCSESFLKIYKTLSKSFPGKNAAY